MNWPDVDRAKETMFRRDLLGRGIGDRRLLAAMRKVPRERFLPAALRNEAYADRALAIGCDQTISQPYIVALMTEALDLTGPERVLEIGTGSGYQAAVLAELAQEVVTIERHEELSRQAGILLADLGYRNVSLVIGDGTLGWPAAAPYDRVLVTAAAATVPPPLFEQLADGGILVLPLGGKDRQLLQAIRKTAGGPVTETLTACRFVPLIGSGGWPG
jgi:protein-L-isoaspartate(D-aspartate) O-methyltransferase